VANIKQQKKRILVGQRQRLENLRYRSTIKTYFRRLQTAIDGGDTDAVAVEHVALVRLIDKAGAKRILNAASIVSRGPQEIKAKRKKAVRK
jgi:small subunit ribosomal protein S20